MVLWLYFGLANVIGNASAALPTGNPDAELVNGSKSENLVLTARAVMPDMSASVNTSETCLDMNTSPG